MSFTRRDFLRAGLAGTAALSLRPRIAVAAPRPGDPLWIHVMAMGAWDPAIICDPRPELRSGLNRTVYVYGVPVPGQNGMPARGTGEIKPPSSTAIRTTPGGGIRYLGFADFHADLNDPNHPYKPFFPTYYDRITVINGIDTATINHDVGARYSASGSANEGFPCFASQVAAAVAPELPLSFLDLGGYDDTGGLVAAAPLTGPGLASLLRVMQPNDLSGDNLGNDPILSADTWGRVKAAHQRRLSRLLAEEKLPSPRRALSRLLDAERSHAGLAALRFNANDQSLTNLLRVGVDAFRQGLAASMNVPVGGFDSHGDNEQAQAYALYNLFEAIKQLLVETETPQNGKAPVPAVIVVTSDFGRSPYYRNAGTDHWPVTSAMIVQNALAKRLNLNLPTNRTIGATTDGDATQAIKPRLVDPRTLMPDAGGVTLTPGHVIRALRRLAKIDGSPALARHPLSVDRDLAIG